MSEAVSWVLMLSVKDGQLDAVRDLMEEMVAAAQDEPGTTVYEWFVSDDESSVHTLERFASSEAVMAHLGSFGDNFAERFFAALEPTGWYAYGDPDSAAREALTGSGAEILGPFGGFAR